MAMHIDKAGAPPLSGNGHSTGSVRQQHNDTAQDRAVAKSDTARDEVRLTSISTRLRELESVASGSPEVDMDRVNALREAIESGEYRVDSERVASRLVDLESRLFKE